MSDENRIEFKTSEDAQSGGPIAPCGEAKLADRRRRLNWALRSDNCIRTGLGSGGMTMIRVWGIMTVVGRLLAKAAVGLVGLVIVAALVPHPEPEARERSESGEPTGLANSVLLRVPAGEQAGHLSVVDEQGRELAVLTRWRNGQTSLVASRHGGASLGCYLNTDGVTSLELLGSAQQTTIEVRPDGITRTMARDAWRLPDPVPAPGSSASDHSGSGGSAVGASADEASAISVSNAAFADRSHPLPPT
jgi:hypothetical protein